MYEVCRTCGRVFRKGKRPHKEAIEYYYHSFTCGKEGYRACFSVYQFPTALCSDCSNRYTCWTERMDDWVEFNEVPYKYDVCSICGEYVLRECIISHSKACSNTFVPCNKCDMGEVCTSCEYRFICYTVDNEDKKIVSHCIFTVEI